MEFNTTGISPATAEDAPVTDKAAIVVSEGELASTAIASAVKAPVSESSITPEDAKEAFEGITGITLGQPPKDSFNA